ncbi:hypothetical protein MNQ95_06705 [Pseudoxanthomonas daejeonensis]|uniref:Phytase-like domain-containing protein n=1 Tax=Pseudoxanthomonas daejeonensis TaxID=266062 RepID=A0ABQ6ZC38_9GAMM|nr:hypothetical protein [Pseudoxanthomonas daejeonensis]KAF1697586.1 hypothetical protein CSC65_01640 [Pseudoxanthomonas daejeonensis]UNK58767.1 hypothetical protein MNQ95_06705 [Pseudoxanthomonas daejeonensis]
MPLLPSRPLVLSSLLLCLVVPPALSQVRVTPPVVKPVKPATPSQAPQLHLARIEGLRDNGPAAIDRPLPAGWALAGFDLRFGNGDHKLRRIGVLGEERFVRFALADSNGDDPFNGAARLTALPGVRVQQVSAEGGGKFEIPLPGRAPADSTLVLSGFEFRRADGTDANLRNVGLWLVPERNVVQVSLTDDQGMDFRGLEATLGAAAASAVIPLPGLLETATVMAGTGAATKGIAKMSGKYRGYRVTVQYAWIPNALVAQKGALAGTQARRGATPSSRIDALQGFEFTFNNSDHHLLGLGMNSRGNGDVFFQDNNTDDPLQWSATYLTLRGGR